MGNHQQQPPIYESIASKTGLDYRHLDTNLNNSVHSQLYPHENDLSSRSLGHNHIQPSHIEYRQKPNGTNINSEYRLSSGSDTMPAHSDFVNLSNSSIANQLLSTGGGSGGGNGSSSGGSVGIMTATLPRGGSSVHHSNKENRNHHNSNRNHIITDTLPGPESCV